MKAQPRAWWRLLWPILGAISVPALFNVAGFVKEVEGPLVRVATRYVKAPQGPPVTVVQIADADFQQIFQSHRPLAPAKLAEVIDAIAALGPRAIAVDIDTSDPVFRVLAGRKWYASKSPKSGAQAAVEVPVVWARRATFSKLADRFYVTDVLGGVGAERTAVAELAEDRDKVVRSYRRSFPTDKGKILALPIELLRAGGLLKPGDEDGERTINFYGNTSGDPIRRWWSSAVLRAAREPDIAAGKPLRDRIVLLGGAFQGVDELETPLGWMRGVVLLAHIAETDSGNAEPAARTALLAVVFLGACLIAVCFETTRGRTAVLVSLSGILCSLLLYWTYTRVVRDALLVGTALVVIVGQRIYLKIKQASKEKAEAERSPDASGSKTLR
ncbi:MAG: CHASE2 domain-containing protein [Candidatus Solibacter sp.]|nr:CHASE2 domain-containing protein [Candidatus Solibacter sp.]